MNNRYSKICVTVSSVLLAACLGWGAVAAQGANVLQTFFVALPEDDMQVSLNAVDAYRGKIGDVMASAISMVVGTDGTIMYYDHWEDGYEADITSPTQTTSQVWGDADTSNGFPPGFPSDVLDAGDVVRLESEIDVTRNSVTIEYDGRDKVAVTAPIAMTRAMYAVDPGEVLAGSMGVFDAGTHGTLYRAPVGVGTGTGYGTNDMFSYSSFYIMAESDFTRIDIDADNDGVFEDTRYLDQGEVYFVNGGVVAGATVQGSQPFQCHLITGDVGGTYEMRWIELWPEAQWGSDYFLSVGSRVTGGTTYPSLVYLFNPNASTITVTYVTATNTGTFTVDPDSVYDVFQMPVDGGARFYTADGSPFIGANAFDTSIGGGTLWGFPQHCQTYDWGIGLMPVNMMSTMGVVGWGPGHGSTAPGTNGSPVWVSALTNTLIYVDYDSDPDTGPLVDPQGNRYDVSTNVSPLQTVRLVDPTDNDQTGLKYYTLDGTVLMGTWGEDPAWAQPGNPYLDMGYAIPAFPTILSRKFASLLTDVNTNGYADAGDEIEYFVDIINVGYSVAANVIFQDEPPTNLTLYLTNSATLNSNAVPDSLPPKLTRFPFDEGGYNVGTILQGETSTVRYVTQVLTNLPSDFDGYIHNNATVGGTNGNWTGGWTIPVRLGGLSIEKETSTTNLLAPGSNFSYTITVENTGTVTFTGIQIDDVLPLGVSYVDGSAQIQLSGAVTNIVSDEFDERSYTNSNGNIPWLIGWQEIGESDGVAAGNVQVKADVTNTIPLEAYAMRIGGSSYGAVRQADLSGHSSATFGFDYRRDGLDGATDYVDVFISSNNWATSNLLVRIQGAGTDTTRTTTNFNVTPYISTNTGIRFLSSATLGAADYVWFDNATFTLTGTNATFAGQPPPLLAQNITLPPGASVTATLSVQVDNPPLATQVVNRARTRADQQSPWEDSNPVTNAIDATEGITLLKTSSTTNLLVAGTNVEYTILISNTGTIWQTGIQLEDILPYGMTYSNGTAELYRPFQHTNVFLDYFNFQTYSNSDGNVDWAGDWSEISDDNDPLTGNIRIAVDGTSIPGQTYAVRTAAASGLERAANLDGYTNAVLWFDYRRVGLETGEFVNISASANNGGSFTQVGQIGGATNDGSYFPASFDISAYASTGTVIRFQGSAGRDTGDLVWLDNIRIDESASSATNPLPDPPGLLDGYTLPAMTNMTVTLTATVDDPLLATTFINTARLMSDQQTTWITSRVTNAAAGIAAWHVEKTSDVTSVWSLQQTNTYTITVENTGTLTLTEISVADLLPTNVVAVSNSTIVKVTDIEPLWTNTVTTYTTNTVRDEFNAQAYTNNDGTVDWNDDWQENDPYGTAGPVGDYVGVTTGGGQLFLTYAYVGDERAWRAADLSGNDTATLRYDWQTVNLGGSEEVSVMVSTNGASPFVEVATYNGTTNGSAEINITSYMSTNTTIRLENNSVNWSSGDYGYLDNVEIEMVSSVTTTGSVMTNVVIGVTTNAGGDPPSLTNSITLGPQDYMTITFQALMDPPLSSTQFVNTATASSAQLPDQSASVTNWTELNAVGDFVWDDLNGDGIQDPGEPGLSNVTVYVYNSDSNLIGTTTSDANGAYSFTNLPSGSYFLGFLTPTNVLPTAEYQGGDPAKDSDIDTNGFTAVFSLSGGTNDTTRDAGYAQPPSSIGDFVWNDLNGNGIQDGGSETGMPNVVVTLYDASSNVVGVTTSSLTGAYSFTNLPPASYFVGVALPSGFTYTLQNQGSDDTVDSDVSPLTGRTDLFYLPPGTDDPNRDAGLVAIVDSLTLTKTSDAASCLDPGDTLTYTMTIQNTGTVAQTGITLYDPVSAGLTYVSNSAVMIVTQRTVVTTYITNTVRDEFNAVAFTNQDGTANWANDWQEIGESNGASGNAVRVQEFWGTNYQLKVYNSARAGWREVDLSGMDTATLTYDYRVVGIDPGEASYFSVSTNGGSSWIPLLTHTAQVTTTTSTNFNLTPYISANTAIAFSNAAANGGGEGWQLDDIQIEFVSSSFVTNTTVTTNLLDAPPTLVTNLTLNPGSSATITFQATVDSPTTVTQLLNTASTYSAVQPAIFASVTNCVKYADVGVLKSVTDPTPDQVDIIEYILVATNNGPDTATGMQMTDVLPAEVQYNSHSNGTYSDITKIWDIGTLAAHASTTLYINVTVRENTSGLDITNTVTITGRDLYDPVSSNDTSSVVIVPRGGVTVGDWVWFDANANGIQDAGETNGIANLSVALVDTNGNVMATTTTDAGGNYLFTNKPPRTYQVRFDLRTISTNVGVTVAHAGSDPSKDSDVTSGDTGDYGLTDAFTMSSGQTNLNLDLGLARKGSTRAELAEVWGEWINGEGRVAWRTRSEWNTAGFFVYRIDPETGAETRLNDILIPSAFSGSGAIYGWTDPAVREGDTVSYRLEEVELSGAVLDLGAHEVTIVESPPVAKAARAEVAARRARRPLAPAVKATIPPTGTAKVSLRKEGLYGVSLQALADGMGTSLAEIQNRAAAGQLAFRSNGKRIPVLYDEARQRLVFYGRATTNWYTRDAAVMIAQGEGLAMARRNPDAVAGETVFPVELRFEQDQYPFDSATSWPEDFYYWEYVISGNASLGQRDFALDLTGATGGDVDLSVRLMGWSSTEQDPDHLAEFLFNGTPVGSITFDGQEQIEAPLTISGSLVSNGLNTLSVKGVLQPGHTHSYFVVDRIDAALDRELAPLLEGTALFRAGTASHVSAQSFTNPLAVALSNDKTPTWIADENGELPAKAWAVAASNELMAVIEVVSVPLLTPEPAVADAWFLADTNRIDELIITSRELAAAAQELADYRSGQGLRVGVATFEDICDLMTDGLRTPEAIPALLAYAKATWEESPWLVVLAGNGHYDYLNALNAEINPIPPMMLQTHDGIFASDSLLVDAAGDGLPDVAIGRLPARTAAELTEMITKIKAYEADFGTAWQNDLVLAADAADSTAGDFSGANTRLASLASAPHAVSERIDLDTDPIATARTHLLDQFDTGAGFIHYTGHGGLKNLSGQGLLTDTDVSSMANSRRPVLVALSCLVGRFEAPGIDSLGELLMRQTGGGAVAVWGPSGLSRNAPASELGEAFYRGVLQEGAGTLGPAILQARRSLQGDLFTRDTLSIYNLLGDPALRVAGNTDGAATDRNFAQWRWQRFAPTDLTNSAASGATSANFFAYAMGEGDPLEMELSEGGGTPALSRRGVSAGPGFILKWKRRIRRSDVNYQLWLSENLLEWFVQSPDRQTIDVNPDPDGIMETVRTWVYCPPANRIYVGVKAERQ